MDLIQNCTSIIPANPDISGVGVRAAIYIQNLLSFFPAFYALLDGKISVKELETVEKQSTTILITAFAVLISAIVQAATIGLSSFHTSIILNLSWMNNTNTFIYFLLYIHHKGDPDRNEERIEPQWSAWRDHILQSFRLAPMRKSDAESSPSVSQGRTRSFELLNHNSHVSWQPNQRLCSRKFSNQLMKKTLRYQVVRYIS
jgi:hypothetical protein